MVIKLCGRVVVWLGMALGAVWRRARDAARGLRRRSRGAANRARARDEMSSPTANIGTRVKLSARGAARIADRSGRAHRHRGAHRLAGHHVSGDYVEVRGLLFKACEFKKGHALVR